MGKKQEAIDKPAETALAPVPRGLEGVDQCDLILPRLAIEHKGPNAGHYVVNLLGVPWSDVVVVPLRRSPGRCLWDKNLDNTVPLCRSNDGLAPDSGVENPRAERCTEAEGANRKPLCKLAAWTDDPATGRRVPPACSETMDFLVAVTAGDGEVFDTPIPCALTFTRTSLKTGKRVLSALVMRQKDIYDLSVSLRLHGNKQPDPEWYVPEAYGWTENEPGQYRAIADQVASYDLNKTEAAE